MVRYPKLPYDKWLVALAALIRACRPPMRLSFQILVLVTAIGTAPESAAESPWRELDGVFLIGGPAIGDVSQEVRDARTHIRFGVFGEAAEEMWQMIDAPAVFDACGEDHMTKRSGSIECGYYEADERYECYFGIGVTTNDVVPGAAC